MSTTPDLRPRPDGAGTAVRQIALPRSAFVTGASGFLGRALVERLRAGGVEVRGVDRVADPQRSVLAGDVSVPGEWQDAVAACELVVNAAAIVSNVVPRAEQWAVGVLGARRVVEAAARAGAKRVVQVSSVRAYGDAGFPDLVEEGWPVRPDGNAYVDLKVAAEQVVLQAHAADEVDVTVVRPADVYGPGSRPWVLLPLEAARRDQLLLPASGRGVSSPVHVDDVVDGILAAAAPAGNGQVFNLVGPAPVTTTQYFGHLTRWLGKGEPRGVPTPAAVALATAVGAWDRARGRESELNAATVRYLARTGSYSGVKAERVLGHAPRVDLDTGMQRTRRWCVDQGLLPGATG